MSHKTIFSLSTYNLRSALHVHRISGVGCYNVLKNYLLVPKNKKPISFEKVKKSSQSPFSKYVLLVDKTQAIIDDVMITCYFSPKSYTGEDLVEVSCHGNPIISKKLHSFFRSLGFIDAKPGEFTYRAFLNGKLDFVQSEAIQQIIHAESFAGLSLARKALKGTVSQEIKRLRKKIIASLAYIEAHIDFESDEVGEYLPALIQDDLACVMEELNKLSKTYSSAQKLKAGLKVCLIGEPNVGKSTLFNNLSKSDNAIVTDIPGTTRDILKEHIIIGDKDFIIFDTAGVRETNETVEKIGVEKTKRMVSKTDLVCLLVSIEKHANPEFFETLLSHFHDVDFNKVKKIIVFTKTDLVSKEKRLEIERIFKASQFYKKVFDYAFISNLDIQPLIDFLIREYDALMGLKHTSQDPILISERQKDKIEIATRSLKQVIDLIKKKYYPEIIASELNNIKDSLEEIVGRISVDDIYETLFSSFCIGK